MPPMTNYIWRSLIVQACVLLAADGTRVVQAAGEDARSIPGWGQVVDPDRDCEIVLEGASLKMTVPGTLHDLNVRRAMNAPRVVQELEGDFQLQVKVTGAFTPGPASVIAGSDLRFNSAGLLLWSDQNNYVRLERNIMQFGATTACMPPLFELFSDGQYRGASPATTTDPYFEGDSTWLRLERRGDYFLATISHDGQHWLAPLKRELILPDRLQVGVAALNTSNAPHTVTFSELKLITRGG